MTAAPGGRRGAAQWGGALLALALAGGGAAAGALPLPAGAERAAERVEPYASYAVATGPWAGDTVPAIAAEGRVTLEAWQVPGSAGTLALLAPLREALAAEGYRVLYDCAAAACGGFDFRYGLEVLPEPEMHVDLADFRFLAARRAGEGPEPEPSYVTLLVSRSTATGYVQIARVEPADPPDAAPAADQTAEASALPFPGVQGAGAAALAGATPEAAAIAAALDRDGRAVLPGLSFGTGSSRLAPGDFPVLAALADYLAAHPDRRVTLVGHTDAQGSLEANVALSRARARSVMERLVGDYGVPANRLDAQGVGYLMPLASNLTEDGRALNRRVEAVLSVAE